MMSGCEGDQGHQIASLGRGLQPFLLVQKTKRKINNRVLWGRCAVVHDADFFFKFVACVTFAFILSKFEYACELWRERICLWCVIYARTIYFIELRSPFFFQVKLCSIDVFIWTKTCAIFLHSWQVVSEALSISYTYSYHLFCPFITYSLPPGPP